MSNSGNQLYYTRYNQANPGNDTFACPHRTFSPTTIAKQTPRPATTPSPSNQLDLESVSVPITPAVATATVLETATVDSKTLTTRSEITSPPVGLGEFILRLLVVEPLVLA
ncbi:MAG: hypothetical protein F6J90_16030 [Moorea sp. SIOASIH]|uniref:hypothetical protein n=1 Tax=Moorena sp. SIOASIH TaxID=2607817 RepID=UPI0013B5FAE2|nr:hypothetical protein [Moorena sp. SIOASIH]NEO37757.1 hypothetical protein [Moorena sp. SIOASIH]